MGNKGKVAGGGIASTLAMLATYGCHAAGLDIPGEVIAAGASFFVGVGTWVGHRFDLTHG